MFKSLNDYRYVGMEDSAQEFLFENSSININFLNNRTGETTAGTYLVSIAEFVSNC